MYRSAAGGRAERWIERARKTLGWSRAVRALFTRWHRAVKRGSIQPTGFLVEVYNPEAAAELQLIMRSYPASGTPPFAARLKLPPGYSSHYFEAENFRAVTESGPLPRRSISVWIPSHLSTTVPSSAPK